MSSLYFNQQHQLGMVVFIVLLFAMPVVGQQGDSRDWASDLPDRKQSKLEREIEILKKEIEELKKITQPKKFTEDDLKGQRKSSTQPEVPPDFELELTPFWTRDEIDTPRSLRSTYDRPFLASLWRKAYVGGYTELEYHNFKDGVLGIPRGFRMHRTNLFLFTEMSERLRFGSEIEFETEFDGAENSSDIEVALEMAFVDWTWFEELKLRGGTIVVPLGRVNVNHDGPVRELTERPLVSTFVIPSTLSEVGAGLHGTFTLSNELSLSYEAYFVNGLNVLNADGELSAEITEKEQILREGKTSLGGDNNSRPASTGRVSLDLFNKLELGASWHVGTYDEKGDNLLRIFAGDFAWVEEFDSFQLDFEGEIATADFERDSFAKVAGVPEQFWGYYIQGSISGLPDFLHDSLPFMFDQKGASIGLVFRYEYVDLNKDLGEVFEPGIVLRPSSDTAFKFSYRFTSRSIGLRTGPGREDFRDDGFVFSLTSYF